MKNKKTLFVLGLILTGNISIALADEINTRAQDQFEISISEPACFIPEIEALKRATSLVEETANRHCQELDLKPAYSSLETNRDAECNGFKINAKYFCWDTL